MLDQNTFTETIRAVQDIIRTSAEPMTREEILSYFKDMDLNAQQEEMVLEFLSTPHDDPQPEENEPETKEAEYEETAEKEETFCEKGIRKRFRHRQHFHFSHVSDVFGGTERYSGVYQGAAD